MLWCSVGIFALLQVLEFLQTVYFIGSIRNEIIIDVQLQGKAGGHAEISDEELLDSDHVGQVQKENGNRLKVIVSERQRA